MFESQAGRVSFFGDGLLIVGGHTDEFNADADSGEAIANFAANVNCVI